MPVVSNSAPSYKATVLAAPLLRHGSQWKLTGLRL